MKLTHLVFWILLVSTISCQQRSSQNETASKEATPQIFKKTKKKTMEEKAQSVIGRWEYEQQLLRNPTTGQIPAGERDKSMKFARQSPTSFSTRLGRNSSAIVVEGRGPGNLGGRTRAIAFDQRNANIILAGGISGGMFRTTNGGNSWVKVSPNNEIHNVSAVAQDPTNPDVWYYGTGENFGNSASASGATYIGQGAWRSADNGQTWTPLTSTQGGDILAFDNLWDVVNRMIVHPGTGDVYAAANNAIFRSQDDGVNWNVVVGSANAAGFSDVIITPSGRVYAAFQGSDASEGVWTSANGNNGSWTKIAGGGSATTPGGWNGANGYGRVVINYAPSSENLVYALYYNNTNSACGGGAAPEAELFRWNLSTNSWTNLSANLPDEAGCLAGNDPFAAQGGYDLCVVVKPNDPNVVFIGGTNVYRSTNGFTSTGATTRIGGYVSAASYGLYPNHHPDIHYLAFAPGDNNNLYTATDGGVHRGNINNTNVSWTSLNNDYTTYQYYHVDLSPNAGENAIIGGAQDNGTTTSGAGTTHAAAFGGDGAGVGLINYTSAANFNIIASTQNGNLVRLNGPSSGFGIAPTGASSSIFVTYFHLDQDNTNYLYYADGPNLYRTRIASSITAGNVTGNSGTGWQQMTGVSQGSNIRAMATSRGTGYNASDASKKLLIGLQNGSLYRLNDPGFTGGGTAPTNITPAGSSGTIIGISINPQDDNEALVVFSNYGVNSVYHTTNVNAANPNWTNIEGSGAVQIASSRSCVIASDGTQTLYFVGTSTGLYCTDTPNGGSTSWTRVGENEIGFAIASSMRYRPSDQKLLVGTHGNGMFMLDIEPVFQGVVDCTRPTAAECGGNYTGDTASGGDSYTNYSGNTGWTGNEYIYEITTDASTSAITIDLTNTGAADLGVFLLSTCDPSTAIASANANGGGGNEQILNFNLAANTTYYIVVDGQSNATGTFSLAVTCIQPPSCTDGILNGNETGIDCGGPDCPACPTCTDGVLNGNETGVDCGGPDCPACPDSCGAASPISCGQTINGNTTGGTNSYNTYLPDGYTGWNGPEAVYSFTAPANGSYTIDLAYPGGTSAADLDIFLFDICDPTQNYLAVSFNAPNTAEQITATLTGGTTYYIIIDGDGTGAGAFDLTLTCPAAPPTCTDGILNGNETGVDCGGPDCPACPVSCDTPNPISCGQTINGNTTGGLNSYNTYLPDGYTGWNGPEAVYSFTAPANGSYTIDLAYPGGTSTADLDIFLFDVCDPTQNYIGVSFNAPNTAEQITATLTGGTTYYIIVDGDNTDAGAFELTLTCPVSTVSLTPKVFLQGPLSSATMNTALYSGNLIPTTSPYADAKALTGTTPTTTVDWVYVEIRDANDPTIILSAQSGLLMADGMVMDSDGVSPLTFPLAPDNYYVAIKHRNHLSVMTGAAIPLSN